MNRRFLLALIVLTFAATFPLAAKTSPDALWNDDPVLPATKKAIPATAVRKFKTVGLNLGQMKAALARSPREHALAAQNQPLIITVPMPDGTFAKFKMEESPIMEPALAAKFPSIKTYSGRGVDDPTASIRLSITPRGFHAQILSPKGAIYVDPFDYTDPDFCVSYYKRDLANNEGMFRCVADAPVAVKSSKTSENTTAAAEAAPEEITLGTTFRVFRIAVAATAQYTTFHSSRAGHSANVADGLAAIVVTMNRVSGIYERELAIRLLLVGNNDQIVFTSASSDPYVEGGSAADAEAMINANQTTIDNIIGSANYDVGHLFALNASSRAGESPYANGIGHVCINGWKAKGVTGRNANAGGPVGDGYDVDYVAHEIGHQFGGRHSFNCETGACGGGTRETDFSYEPGSGTTIMGYAGICGTSTISDNVQNNSDAYFHSISLENIKNYITSGTGFGDCAATSSTGNHAPTVDAGPHYYIPKGTPFRLTATGSDSDGDTVSFCWEERDLGPAQSLADPDNGSSPLFRSYFPTDGSSTRIFPRFAERGTNSAIGEKLPSLAREMQFRVTARDQRPIGAFTTDDTSVSVIGTAGPFSVTYPNDSSVSWAGGTYQTIQWNVANTDLSPIFCPFVEIYLSVDDGVTYPILLNDIAANDGSERIQLPALVNTSTQCRIKVQARGNIFFDVSDQPFTILEAVYPANNAKANAQNLGGGSSGGFNGSNINASQEINEPYHFYQNPGPAYTGGRSVWYRWTPTQGGLATFSLNSSELFGVMAVYETGSDWNGLKIPRLADAYSTNQLIFNASKGREYFIVVDGLHDQDFGNFQLNWSTVIDSTPPTLAFSPLTNQQSVFNFNQFGGSMSEASTVTFVIEEYNPGGTNRYWDGGAWVFSTNNSTFLSATRTENNWQPASGTLPPRGQTRYGSYLLYAYATDAAGNTGENNIVLIRTAPDLTPPVLNIAVPIADTVFTNNFLPTFSGTAIDPESGVATVNFLLHRNGPSGLLFWNGSAWTDTPINLAVNYDGNSSWTAPSGFSFPSGANLPNTTYTLTVGAVNNEDPSGSSSLGVTFSVDYHPVFVWTAGSFTDQIPGNENHNWNNAANWDVGDIPSTNAIVIINAGQPNASSMGNMNQYAVDLNGGSLSLSGITISKRLTVKGDLIGGAVTIVSNAVCNWGGGSIQGTWQIVPGAQLTINASNDIVFSSGTLDNRGTILWTNTAWITGANGATITNQGLFQLDGSKGLYFNNSGARALLLNTAAGTIRKTTATTNTLHSDYAGWQLDNYGTIDIQAGALLLRNQFKYLHGGAISGNGRVRSESGVLTLAGNTTLDGGTVQLAGDMNGSGSFSGTGVLDWSVGNIYVGQATNMSGVQLLISSGGPKWMGNGSLFYQNGPTLVTEPGNIVLSLGAQFRNSGFFQVVTNTTFYFDNNGAPAQFINLPGGTVQKTSTNVAFFHTDYGGVRFVNAGLLDVQAGTFRFGGGGGPSSGEFHTEAGAAIEFVGNTQVLTNGATITGSGVARARGGRVNAFTQSGNVFVEGTFEVSTNGTFGGVANFAGSGSFNWNAGYIDANLTVSSGLTMNILGDAGKTFESGRIINEGVVNWNDNGDVTFGLGAAITNKALFHAQGTAAMYFNNSGARGAFYNEPNATFRKSGAGTNRFALDYNGILFYNRGNIDAQQGMLLLQNNDKTFYQGGSISGAGRVKSLSGTLTLAGVTTFSGGTVELAGDLVGNGGFDGNGTFNWFSGSVRGGARMTNGPSVELLINGIGGKWLSEGSILQQFGPSVSLDSGAWVFSNGAQFLNAGLFEVRTNTVFYYDNSGSPTWFRNQIGGTLRTVSTNLVFFHSDYGGVNLENDGLIDVQAGMLKLGGGGSDSSGEFRTAAGGVIEFSADTQTLAAGASITGSGVTRLLGGRVNANSGAGNVIVDGTFEISTNGAFGGTATLAGSGVINWNASVVDGALNLASGLTMNILGDAQKYLDAGRIVNEAAVNWLDAGGITFNNGATFTNKALFHAQANAAIQYLNSGARPMLVNAFGAVLRKSGAATSTIGNDYGGIEFQNYGNINVQEGVLVLQNQTKRFFDGGSVSGAARVKSAGGLLSISGTTTFNGGTVELAGDLSGLGSFQGAGTFDWSGGSIYSSILTNGLTVQFLVSPGGSKWLGGSSLLQQGPTVVTEPGYVYLSQGAQFINAGVFELRTNTTFAYDLSGQRPTFSNLASGTLRKTGSTGTATFAQDYGGINFNNAGVIDLRAGALAMNSPNVSASSSQLLLTLGGTNQNSFARETFTGVAELNGVLKVGYTNGYAPAEGDSFTLLSYGARSGQFSSSDLPPLAFPLQWKLVYGANAVTLTAQRAHILSQIAAPQNGQLLLDFSGPAASSAVLQTSTNLNNWHDVATNMPFDGTFQFVDPQATGFSKFYRVLVNP